MMYVVCDMYKCGTGEVFELLARLFIMWETILSNSLLTTVLLDTLLAPEAGVYL